MKLATFNVNGRLPVLLRWLDQAAPDIVCLRELKAPQDKFPEGPIREAGYGAIWHGQKSWNGVAILARGADPVETRRGLPGDPDDTQSRNIRLYMALRHFVNFFQPAFRLAEKSRDGAKVKKTYLPPATRCQRLLADTRITEDVRCRVTEIRSTLDPVRLLQTIREIQQELVEIADRPVTGEAAAPAPRRWSNSSWDWARHGRKVRCVRPASRRRRRRAADGVPIRS
jgi:hypothetical protein